MVLKGDRFEHDFDKLYLLVLFKNIRGIHDRWLPTFTHLHQRVLSHHDLVLIFTPSRRHVLVARGSQDSTNAGVPTRLVVLMPDKKPSFHIHVLPERLVPILVPARIEDGELIIDGAINIAGEDQVVVFDRVLVVPSPLTLIRVELPMNKDELVSRWEQVSLCAHAKGDFRVVVDQAVP